MQASLKTQPHSMPAQCAAVGIISIAQTAAGRMYIGRAEIAGVVPGFGRAEPVAFRLVDDVMDAPRRVVGLFRHPSLRSSAAKPKLVPTQTSWACSLSRMMSPFAAMPLAAPISPLPNFITLVAKIFFAAESCICFG